MSHLNQQNPVGPDLDLLDLISLVSIFCSERSNPGTAQSYQSALGCFTHWLESHPDLVPSKESFSHFWLEYKKSHGDLTVYRVYHLWRLFFSSVKLSWLPVSAPSTPKLYYRRGILTSDQCCQLLSLARSSDRDLALLWLGMLGCRRVEVHRLNCGSMAVLANRTAVYVQGKGCQSSDDYVVIPVDLWTILLRLRGVRPDWSPLICNCHGTRLSVQTIDSIFRKYFSLSGIQALKISFHSLRHSAAVMALDQGCSIYEVQRFLRHRSTSTTALYCAQFDRLRDPAELKIPVQPRSDGQLFLLKS
jgi:site-specific recombinase XerD